MSTKIALIIGASRGLGRSMALNLAEDGVEIIGTFRGAQDEANKVVDAVAARGGRAAMLQLDVSEPATFAGFVSRVRTVLSDTFRRRDLDSWSTMPGSAGTRRSLSSTLTCSTGCSPSTSRGR